MRAVLHGRSQERPYDDLLDVDLDCGGFLLLSGLDREIREPLSGHRVRVVIETESESVREGLKSGSPGT